MAFQEDREAEAIAAEWGVSVELLQDATWELETIDGNDGETYGYVVRFDDETDPQVLAQLGISPGEFTKQLSINAFDEPEPDWDYFSPVESTERADTNSRSYYIDDERFTPAQFRRLSQSRKVEAMVQWFHANYEDPAVRTPFESAEGGYQWIWGGPYDAREQIGDQFSDIANEETIELAVDEVTSDGLFDWAPKERPEDYEQDDSDDGIRSVEEPLPDLSGDYLSDDGGQFPDLPPGQAYLTTEDGSIVTDERGRGLIANTPITEAAVDTTTAGESLKLDLLSKIEVLEGALKTYQENLPPRNHNHPPELVEPDPITPRDFKIVVEVISDLKAAAQQEAPEPIKLEQQASTLRTVARSIINWIGRKTDTAIDSAIKWSVPLGGAWMLAHPEKVAAALTAVAETASRLAQHFIGG
jgi:hypothetical protein